MLQEKTPLQRKTRSESAGEGRKAGRGAAVAGRGEEGDSGVASVGLVGEERERAHVSVGGAVGKRIAPFFVCRNLTLENWQHNLGIMERRDFRKLNNGLEQRFSESIGWVRLRFESCDVNQCLKCGCM